MFTQNIDVHSSKIWLVIKEQMFVTDTIKNQKKTLNKLLMDNKLFVWTKYESLTAKRYHLLTPSKGTDI